MTDDVGTKWEILLNERTDIYHSRELLVKKYFERKLENRFVKEILKYSADKHSCILEAGCGSGYTAIALAILGKNVTVLDISQRVLDGVNYAKLFAEKYYGKLRIETIKGDLKNLNELIINKKYDIVFNHGVIEHWLNDTDRIDVLTEMCGVTKQNGYLIIAVPNNKDNPLYRLAPLEKFAPEMAKFDIYSLRQELIRTGCKVVHTAGLGVSDDFEYWLHLKPLKYVIRFGNALFPILPKRVQERLGAHIFCVGLVP